MAKAKPKKTEKKDKKYSLKDLIQYLELKDDDEIFIHLYSKRITHGPVYVKDVNATLLKKKIIVVQPKYGGKECNYNCYMFIVE